MPQGNVWAVTHNGIDQPTEEKGPDNEVWYLGQKHYRDAHIHLFELCCAAGVTNITWMFHINADDSPREIAAFPEFFLVTTYSAKS